MSSIGINQQLNPKAIFNNVPNTQFETDKVTSTAQTTTANQGDSVSISDNAINLAKLNSDGQLTPKQVQTAVSHKGIEAYQQIESMSQSESVSGLNQEDSMETASLLNRKFTQELDAILSEQGYLESIGMSQADRDKLTELGDQIDAIYEGGEISEQQTQQLLAIEKQMDEVFVQYEEQIRDSFAEVGKAFIDSLGLSEQDQSAYDTNNKTLENLYSQDSLSEQQQLQLMELEQQQEALLEKYV